MRMSVFLPDKYDLREAVNVLCRMAVIINVNLCFIDQVKKVIQSLVCPTRKEKKREKRNEITCHL